MPDDSNPFGSLTGSPLSMRDAPPLDLSDSPKPAEKKPPAPKLVAPLAPKEEASPKKEPPAEGPVPQGGIPRAPELTPPRRIDVGLVNGTPFINVVSGGFGSRVTVETDPALKRRLGGLAYLITGISHFSALAANQGRFRAEGFSWEGRFLALAIGNGRQAGGGVPLCPDALIDDGLLDLMILPELKHAARLDAFSHLLRDGAPGIRAGLVTARSSWIEYEAADDLNVNLDGEPKLLKAFRAECRQRALPVRIGESAMLSSRVAAG